MSEISAQTIQTADVFLRENGVRGELLDARRRVLSSPPAIARGAQIKLHIHVFPPSGDSQYSAWPEGSVFRLVASKVFVDSAEGSSEQDVSPEVLVADSVEALEDGTLEATLTNTNTVELANLIGGLGGLTLGMELTRFNASDTTPSFLLQYPLTVLNRRGVEGSGTPQELPDNYITKTAFEAAYQAALDEFNEFSAILDAEVVTIPAATAEYSLEADTDYAHAPESAPIYTLPTLTGDKLRYISVEVSFTSVQTLAFIDKDEQTIPLAFEITPEANSRWVFICRWSPVYAWSVIPVGVTAQ